MTDRSFDRIADAFLAPGPVVLPDRVLDAAFEEVHQTRQRRVLWRAPWRVPIMNTFAKIAVAAVAVIAVGVLGLNLLDPEGSGIGVAPSAVPSPTATPAATPTPTPAPTAPPLTGQFRSAIHGISIAYPAGWTTDPATEPWATTDVSFGEPGADFIHDPVLTDHLFLRLASQPLGERTAEQWAAEMVANGECDGSLEPITIAGNAGTIDVDCGQAHVSVDGRGYVIRRYTSDDEPWLQDVYDSAWFESVLATVGLHPEDAIDTAP